MILNDRRCADDKRREGHAIPRTTRTKNETISPYVPRARWATGPDSGSAARWTPGRRSPATRPRRSATSRPAARAASSGRRGTGRDGGFYFSAVPSSAAITSATVWVRDWGLGLPVTTAIFVMRPGTSVRSRAAAAVTLRHFAGAAYRHFHESA